MELEQAQQPYVRNQCIYTKSTAEGHAIKYQIAVVGNRCLGESVIESGEFQ